jgi:regulator of replication initiation timing
MQLDRQKLVSEKFNIEEVRKKMTNSTRLRTDFKMAVDHIRDRVVSNVVEAKNQNKYSMSDRDAENLIRVIEASFEQGFITASSQVEKSINEITR